MAAQNGSYYYTQQLRQKHIWNGGNVKSSSPRVDTKSLTRGLAGIAVLRQ